MIENKIRTIQPPRIKVRILDCCALLLGPQSSLCKKCLTPRHNPGTRQQAFGLRKVQSANEGLPHRQNMARIPWLGPGTIDAATALACWHGEPSRSASNAPCRHMCPLPGLGVRKPQAQVRWARVILAFRAPPRESVRGLQETADRTR